MTDPVRDNPEAKARRQIDAMLIASGWDVQDRAAMNLAAAPGVAIRELQTSAGPADYLLFLGNLLVGVVEAVAVRRAEWVERGAGGEQQGQRAEECHNRQLARSAGKTARHRRGSYDESVERR